ncbi:MAG: AlpA family phage regulatory protein [Burkholderiaceae bacterium]|nr:AlpA family phage regulatory protein [Burkholderiaceae bacterium]
MATEVLDDSALCRRKAVEATTGFPRSTLYDRIAKRLFTRPVSLGGRAKGWPRREVKALNEARIAGKSDGEIRELVERLEAARTAAPSE